MNHKHTFGLCVLMLTFAAVATQALPLNAETLCNAPATAGAAYGASGNAVRQLQDCLIRSGYSIPAGPTGYYGAQTRAAVKAFYAAHLGLATWHGSWVGPQGRATLARIASSVPGGTTGGSTTTTWKRLASSAELVAYLSEGTKAERSMSGGPVPTAAPAADSSAGGGAAGIPSLPSRASETNVQVAGMDEPDLVKTDGTNIYIGRTSSYGIVWPMMREGGAAVGTTPRPVVATPDTAVTGTASAPRAGGAGVAAMPPLYEDKTKTSIVRAFPLASLGIESQAIPEHGELLLAKDSSTLMVLGYDKITAYNVTNTKAPKKTWTMTYESGTQLNAARLADGTLFLVTATDLGGSSACPIYPVRMGDMRIAIPCGDIWVPGRIEPVSTSYTVLAVTPKTGAVSRKLTLAGERSNTVVSFFNDNLYLTYRSQTAMTEVQLDFFEHGLTSLLSSDTIARIRTIRSYDISPASKLAEVARAVQSATAGMNADERMKWEAEIANKGADYLATRSRELDRTVVTRIPLASLTIAASGQMPGHLLNQFALDEHEGYLRAAVTVGDRWSGTEQVNDVYVLDSSLKIVGTIRDLGLNEQIYAARFIGDKGYLVTFRQIDPFYVLDLSVPTAPKMTGELKIPGYSSYLEPLADDLVLGVGREGGSVKLSVFDVSNPARPIERAKYTLKDSWTEVEQNHRAFLRDPKHEVFFIPTGQGGYVFSYAVGQLTLKATVAGYSVKRAVFIDDLLYIIGEDKIVVLDETTWKKVKELAL